MGLDDLQKHSGYVSYMGASGITQHPMQREQHPLRSPSTAPPLAASGITTHPMQQDLTQQDPTQQDPMQQDPMQRAQHALQGDHLGAAHMAGSSGPRADGHANPQSDAMDVDR